MNCQTNFLHYNGKNKQIYHRCDELSNRLLPSRWNIKNKSTTGVMNYQTDFLHDNGK